MPREPSTKKVKAAAALDVVIRWSKVAARSMKHTAVCRSPVVSPRLYRGSSNIHRS